MKLTSFITLLIILFGCCHDKPVEPDKYWGTSSMVLNDEIKEFKPYCFTSDSTFELYLDGFNEEKFLRYELNFGNLETKKYLADSLEKWNASGINEKEYAVLFTILGDGDVPGNVYRPLENSINYIEINEWNESSKEFKGSFNIKFIIDENWNKVDLTAPDTITISNGLFHARL